MKKRIFLLLIPFVCVIVNVGELFPEILAEPPSTEEKDTSTSKQMIFDTYKKQVYYLYLPKKYRAEERCPMIVALDPGGEGKACIEFWKDIADQYGYAVLGPVNEGVWNAAQDRDVVNLIEMLATKYAINKNEVFVTGFSGGGVFGYCITINYPHIVRAFAPVCACMFNVDSWLKYSRTAHTPILIIHGDHDDVAGRERGAQAYRALKWYGYRVTYLPLKDVGHEWRPEDRDSVIQFFEKYRGR